MHARSLTPSVTWMGAVDWHRRLFDSLIPLPEGTSYNAWLVRGSARTALIDTADPTMEAELMAQLEAVPELDLVIANHAEQDHAGLIPAVLAKYPRAVVLATPKGKPMLQDHLGLPEARVRAVADGETLDLGGRTLEFLHLPWVHWPETMATYLREERLLFSCDFFGSHLATSDLLVRDDARVYEGAKRYYAEIMMPFRTVIRKHLDRLRAFPVERIAPSHGPVYPRPEFILEAYRDWTSETPRNEVVLPFVSMHGSTGLMVRRLVAALVDRGVRAAPFDLAVTDIGRLAMALVDAATLVVGTPTVHVGPHPAVHAAAHLANALRPKLKFVALVNSYGWASKAAEQVTALIPNLKVEMLGAVCCRGLPTSPAFAELDRLADAIAARHRALGLA